MHKLSELTHYLKINQSTIFKHNLLLVPTSLCDPDVTERGLSCSDFSISSKKLMMLCSLASESRAPPSGSAGW